MARYMGGGAKPRRTTNYKKIPCPQCEQRFHSRKAVVEHIVEKHPDFIGSPDIWPEVWEINQQNVLKKTRQEYNSLIKQINNSLCSTEAIAEHFGITISEIFFQNLNITFQDFFSLYEYSYLSTLQEERERIVFDKIKQEICIQKRQLELQQEYDDTINKITLWLNSPKSIAEHFGILLHEDNTIVQKIDVSSLLPFEQYKKNGLTNEARKNKSKETIAQAIQGIIIIEEKCRSEYNSIIKEITNYLTSSEKIYEHFGILLPDDNTIPQKIDVTTLVPFEQYKALGLTNETRKSKLKETIAQAIIEEKYQSEYNSIINEITNYLTSSVKIREYFGILLHEDNTIVQKIDVVSLVPIEEYRKYGLTKEVRKNKLKKCVKNKLLEILYKREIKPIYVFASRASISQCNYDTYRLENGKDILVIKSGMVNCSEFPIPYKKICLYIYEMQYNFITQWEWREIKKIVIKKPLPPPCITNQNPL